MTLQELVKRLKNSKDNLWYAKNSENYANEYINAVLDDINYILKELGE